VGFDRHEHDYVVVLARDGELKLIRLTGAVSRGAGATSETYFRRAGIEHDVINNASGDVLFVEIELKDAAIGKPL
jgi:hypothetical protein